LGSIANDAADASDSEGEVATDSEDEDDANFISLKSSKNADNDDSNEESDDESVDYEDVSSGAEEEVEQDSDDSDFVNDNSGEDFNSSGDDDEEEEVVTEKPVVTKKKKEKLPKQDKKIKSNEATTSKDSPALAAMNQELGNGARKDEFADGDTSDEEDIRNTVGNIPMHWYDEYKHIGYDWDAKKIIKPPVKDAIDNFLGQMDDPNFWRTVKDPQTGQDVILTPEDVALIRRIMSQRNPDNQFEEYAVS
jgi:ribosome biogenesis protein ERB1